MTRPNLFKWVSPILLTALVACGDGNSQPAFWIPVDTGEDDTTTDVVDDTSEDSAVDTAEDAETDAEEDAAEDVETDAEGDTAEDAETDAEEDAAEDTAEDAEEDAEEDAAEDTAEDVETDAPVPDAGVPDADIDLCSVARRCEFRVVLTCDPATGLFSEETVCERNQRCIRGACEALPRTYEMACRNTEDREACDATGLACGGFSAVPMCLHPDNPQDLGEACYGSRDCSLGLLCTRIGFCSSGDAGDPCREPEDCNVERDGCGRDGRCR